MRRVFKSISRKDLPSEKLQAALDEAVRETRTERKRSNRDEMAADAEALFRARAARGAGKTKRGRGLLAKARGERARPGLKELLSSARGVVDSGVADLASNPKHLKGFGRGRRRHR